MLTDDKCYTFDKYGKPITKAKLKECPLCGSPADFVVGVNLYHLGCSKCGFGLHGENANSLIRKWNARFERASDKKK